MFPLHTCAGLGVQLGAKCPMQSFSAVLADFPFLLPILTMKLGIGVAQEHTGVPSLHPSSHITLGLYLGCWGNTGSSKATAAVPGYVNPYGGSIITLKLLCKILCRYVNNTLKEHLAVFFLYTFICLYMLKCFHLMSVFLQKSMMYLLRWTKNATLSRSSMSCKEKENSG